MGLGSSVVPNSLISRSRSSRMQSQIVCWWALWPDSADPAGCDSSLPPYLYICDHWGQSHWQLAHSWLTCLLNGYHLKWQHWLGAGYLNIWGRHQLLTTPDKLSLLLGIHMSTLVGSGAEVWSEMLRAVMPLTHDEWVRGFPAAALLFFFDMMEVEKVPALASKWSWNLIHDRWGICPWLTSDNTLQPESSCKHCNLSLATLCIPQ